LELFWPKIREWKSLGWTIAQHGLHHLYESRDPGLLGTWKKSEFAGLNFEIQRQKLIAGKNILETQGVWDPVFMAPSHTFDETTLVALSEAGFKYITDGYGFYPYKLNDLTAVPQVYLPRWIVRFVPGIYTVCLHVNTMTNNDINQMLDFIKDNRKNIISFIDATQIKPSFPEGLFRAVTFLFSQIARRV
ncbi:MAG TPA: DUF2334 domain-containing protein, partial [Methanosarcina sp.]|nr:DUF2334 domain-containing protein [Methanosarcina sp.]